MMDFIHYMIIVVSRMIRINLNHYKRQTISIFTIPKSTITIHIEYFILFYYFVILFFMFYFFMAKFATSILNVRRILIFGLINIIWIILYIYNMGYMFRLEKENILVFVYFIHAYFRIFGFFDFLDIILFSIYFRVQTQTDITTRISTTSSES